MQIKATQKYIRISPRKVQLVVDAIRNLPPQEALQQLKFIPKAAALPIAKTIRQAMANAANNAHLSEKLLTFKSIQVGKGATYKRWRPVSRGRAHSIYKRTSRLTVILESKKVAKALKATKTQLKAKNKTKNENAKAKKG